MSEIGREIRRRREGKGWSQAELAVYAKSSQPTVNQIESGKRNPSTRTLEKLASALEVEVADLFPKAQAPLSFEAPTEDEEAREWRLLGYVRSWILLLDNLSERWEKAAEEGSFSLDTYMELGEHFEAVHDAVKSLMEGLKRHQGIDALEGAVGNRFRESLLRSARAFQAVNDASLKIYGSNELAQARRRQAQALQNAEADEPADAHSAFGEESRLIG